MPNAETHLVAACDLLGEPEILRAYPWLAEEAPRSAFLMGSISPDVRAVSGQPREATHFFTIPFADDRPASMVMLAEWPQIAALSRRSQEQAAFVAGYMTHLIMDQTWVEMIVMPRLYLAGQTWGLKHPNWRLYCILMTYIEYRAAGRLSPESAPQMALAQPQTWLPFVADRYLREWRDRVGGLIQRGGPRLVSRALAHSCGLSSDDMEALVLSEDAMRREAYPVVAREHILDFEAETAIRCRDQVVTYLADVSGG